MRADRCRRAVHALIIAALLVAGRPARGAAWVRDFGGASDERAFGILQTLDGGFVVAADTSSYGAGDYDFWMLRLDASGVPLWESTYGQPGFDGFVGLAPTTDGGWILVGRHDDPVTNDSDARLVRIDALGRIVLQKSLHGSNPDALLAVAPTADGNFAAAGSTYSFGSGRNLTAWVLKFDLAGNTMWSYRYGSGNEDARGIDTAIDGSLMVGGGSRTTPSRGDDLWVFKLSSAGDLIWSRTYGGVGQDLFVALRTTSDGGIFLLGSTDSFTPRSGNTAAWILKLDEAGAILWQESLIFGTSYSTGEALEVLPDGGCAALISGVAGLALVRFDAQGQVVWARLLVDLGGGPAALTRSSDGDFEIAASRYDMRVTRVQEDGLAPECSLVMAGVPITLTSTTAPGGNASSGRHTFEPVISNISLAVLNTSSSLGAPCPCGTPSGHPTLNLSRSGSETTLSYSSPESVAYDIIRGDLGRLKEMRGDFAAALNDFPSNTCLATNYPITSLTDSLDPTAGLAFFYLVRESNPGCSAGAGKGTFDSGSHHQAAPRDPTIALAMNRCY